MPANADDSHLQQYNQTLSMDRMNYFEKNEGSSTVPMLKNISHHRQPCKTSFDCDSNLICFSRKCVCSLGQVYYKFSNNTPSDSKGMCIFFEQTLDCLSDEECQDIDTNVICDKFWGRCRCRNGFYLNSKTKYCQQNNQIKREFVQKSSSVSRSSTSNKIIFAFPRSQPARKPQYFRLGTSCQKRSERLDCPAEYSYCSNNKCECWPEFEFWENSNITLSNAENNSALSSLQLFTKELMSLASEHDLINDDHDWKIGKCQRKICETDDDCRFGTNNNGHHINLVCNNTVCECPYGYVMHREQQVCAKLIMRRPSCDLTCKIIGSLFASIFVFTLIYWCFYCCIAIVRNFRHHHNRFHYDNNRYSENGRRARSRIAPSTTTIDDQFLQSFLATNSQRRSMTNSILSMLKYDIPPTYDEIMKNNNNDDDDNDNYIEMKEILPRYDSLFKLETTVTATTANNANNPNENNGNVDQV